MKNNGLFLSDWFCVKGVLLLSLGQSSFTKKEHDETKHRNASREEPEHF